MSWVVFRFFLYLPGSYHMPFKRIISIDSALVKSLHTHQRFSSHFLLLILPEFTLLPNVILLP